MLGKECVCPALKYTLPSFPGGVVEARGGLVIDEVFLRLVLLCPLLYVVYFLSSCFEYVCFYLRVGLLDCDWFRASDII